ncbi:MAG: hypothetical protein U1F23_01190 [Lysobacterales bacterium]
MSGPISSTDATFLRRFFTMIALMALLLVVLAFFSHWINGSQPLANVPAHPAGQSATATGVAPPAAEARP